VWLLGANPSVDSRATLAPRALPKPIHSAAPLSIQKEEGEAVSGAIRAPLSALPAIMLKGHKTLIAKKALESLSLLSSHLLALSFKTKISCKRIL